MLDADLTARGLHAFTVCNACRYCEEYCPVFPAIERRRTFTPADLVQIANVCHNCGECLYACQYAPPHPFGVNLPTTLAAIRRDSYAEAAWPSRAGRAFGAHGVRVSLMLWLLLSGIVLAAVAVEGRDAVWPSPGDADFYALLPHRTMVALFGSIGLLVTALVAAGARRFWQLTTKGDVQAVRFTPAWYAIRDALTLKHLSGGGQHCADGEERRSPLRRYMHHATMYGFLLCFGSTSVAALYHIAFGWQAPYGYLSLPVLLGTAGGLGLVIGPTGLLILARRRDPELGGPSQRGLDESFIVLLLVTSLTGLGLLSLRETTAMGILLVLHLGAVLALFVTVPYGKSVHGLYRLLALVRDEVEAAADRRGRPEDTDLGRASTDS